jgi:hypothetical protein
MSITFGATPGCGEKLEAFDPLLPGSEQFRLQHNRAIEPSAVLPDDCAFLQQSGMLVIGQEPSPSCAPTPIAPPSMAASKMNDVSHFLITESNYIDCFLQVSSS